MPDGIDLKRIIDLDPETTVTNDDYTIVDSTNGGAKKFAIGQALNDLKEDLDHNSGQTTITWTNGSYIRTSDTTVDVNSPVIDASWRYAVVSCAENDQFVVNGTGGNAPRVWAFTDSQYNVLLAADANLSVSDLVLTAPKNAAYLIINDKAKNADSFIGNYLVNTVDGIISDLEFDMGMIRDTNILYHESEIVVSGTSTTVREDIYTYTDFEVGDILGIQYGTLTGELNSSAVGYIYGRLGQTIVSYSTLRKDSKSVTYTVPQGVDNILFTLYPSSVGGTTATYTDVLIFNGASPYFRVKNSAMPPLEITPDDTTFFYIGKNMLDPATVVEGEYVNQVSGNFAANSTYNRSGYIGVEGGEKYLVKSSVSGAFAVRCAFYDINKTYISGDIVDDEPYYVLTAPSNAYFMAFSAGAVRFPVMVTKSETDSAYEAYGVRYVMPQYIREAAPSIINLPSKIYAVSGIELNVYFENITENWEDYAWNVECNKGMQFERGYRITPVDADAGTYTISITASPKSDFSVVYSKTATLVISASTAGSGTSKSVIVLGDSTTDNGTVIEKLHANFADDSMGITTLGTRGTAPNNMEGRSGWSLTDYFTKASITYTDGRGTIYNPFYNPSTETFDASYYFANSGIAQPDWFIINMGINDMFSPVSDSALSDKIDLCIGYLQSMVESIQEVSAAIKIGICVTIPPNDSQDAFGKAYACGQTRDRYKHNNAIWASHIISEFSNLESEGVYIIPIHTNLDTVYNMGLETLPVNARNTAVTYESPIGNGGVHPVTSGYWQIADVYTAFLKAQI